MITTIMGKSSRIRVSISPMDISIPPSPIMSTTGQSGLPRATPMAAPSPRPTEPESSVWVKWPGSGTEK